jgi:hypothetical protein
MPQRGALRELATHRVPEQVRGIPAKSVEHRHRIVGHVLGRVGDRAAAQRGCQRAARPDGREVGGLTGVALIVGGHVEALAGQFGDQPGWPPEPGHPQPHHQQQGLTPAAAEFFEGDAGRAVARCAGRAGPGLCHGTSRSQFENAVCKLSLPVRSHVAALHRIVGHAHP